MYNNCKIVWKFIKLNMKVQVSFWVLGCLFPRLGLGAGFTVVLRCDSFPKEARQVWNKPVGLLWISLRRDFNLIFNTRVDLYRIRS